MKIERVGWENCGRNSWSPSQGHREAQNYVHDTVLSKVLSSLLKDWVGTALWNAHWSSSALCTEQLVLPKPNCNRNTESLETKLEACRSACSLLGKDYGDLNLNVQCSLVQKQPGHRNCMAQHPVSLTLQCFSGDVQTHPHLQGGSHRDTTEAFACLAQRHVGSAKDEALVYTPKSWCVSRVLMFPLQAVEKQVTK